MPWKSLNEWRCMRKGQGRSIEINRLPRCGVENGPLFSVGEVLTYVPCRLLGTGFHGKIGHKRRLC